MKVPCNAKPFCFQGLQWQPARINLIFIVTLLWDFGNLHRGIKHTISAQKGNRWYHQSWYLRSCVFENKLPGSLPKNSTWFFVFLSLHHEPSGFHSSYKGRLVRNLSISNCRNEINDLLKALLVLDVIGSLHQNLLTICFHREHGQHYVTKFNTNTSLINGN